MPVTYHPDQKIRVLVRENPKRPNTKAHDAFSLYRSGMTVNDYLGAGGTRGDISWDTRHKFIAVEDPSKVATRISSQARRGEATTKKPRGAARKASTTRRRAA